MSTERTYTLTSAAQGTTDANRDFGNETLRQDFSQATQSYISAYQRHYNMLIDAGIAEMNAQRTERR